MRRDTHEPQVDTGKHRAGIDLSRLGRATLGFRATLAHLRRDCRYTDAIRGPSHAYHVMDIHRKHGCQRYAMAAYYLAGRS